MSSPDETAGLPPDWQALHELASQQEGYFATHQAHRVGYSLQLLSHYVKAGRIVRVRRGVYRIADHPSGPQEELVVVWLWSEQQGVFSHVTALTLHGLVGESPDGIHLTLPLAWKSRRLRIPAKVVTHYADVDENDQTRHGSLPSTGPSRALAECIEAKLAPELVRQAFERGRSLGLFSQQDLPAVRAYAGFAEDPGGPPAILGGFPLLDGGRPVAPPADQFIGREQDFKAVSSLCDKGMRLITILGPPGIGKTRFALEFATRQSGTRRFCDVTGARGVEDICRLVGQTLDVHITASSTPTTAATQLGHALAALGPALVIVDNFEQVVKHGAATLARWVAAAPEARFVVTSREALRLAGEHLYELGPLSLPAPPATSQEVVVSEAAGWCAPTGVSEAAELSPRRADRRQQTGCAPTGVSEAAELFVARAQAVRSSFQPGLDETPIVAEIVRRLDGIPLAIELAAARMGLWSSAQLLERLSEPLHVLASEQRNVSARHATLRAAIEWSWNLLSPWEQTALAQLSVFRGGFFLPAAEAVVKTDFAQAPSVSEIVDGLRQKSLVRAYEPSPGSRQLRFILYEVIREFAEETFQGQSREAAESRFADCMLAEGLRWTERFHGPQGQEARQTLALETDNLVAIHRQSLAAKTTGEKVSRALRVSLVLDPLLAERGSGGLRAALLEQALDGVDSLGGSGVDAVLCGKALAVLSEACVDSGGLDQARVALQRVQALGHADILQPHLLMGIGLLQHAEGSFDKARRSFQEAIRRLPAGEDPVTRGRLLNRLGCTFRAQSRWFDAEECFAGASAVLRKAGARGLELMPRSNLAGVHLTLQQGDSIEEHETLLRDAKEMGNGRLQGVLLTNLSVALQEAGRFDDARRRVQKARTLFRTHGWREWEGIAASYLGHLCHEEGHLEEAQKEYDEALALFHSSGARSDEATLLTFVASVEASFDHIESAQTILQRAEQRAQTVPSPLLQVLLALQHAAIELAQARAAARAGDHEGVRGYQESVRRRIEQAECSPKVGQLSLAEQSDEMRLALRLLRAQQARNTVGNTARNTAQNTAQNSVGNTVTEAQSTLVVGPEGRWFRRGSGARVDLLRRGPTRRVLWALAEHRQQAPGEPLSREALLQASWPGERMAPGSATKRLGITLFRLRKLGLRTILLTRDDGYLLDPDVIVRVGS